MKKLLLMSVFAGIFTTGIPAAAQYAVLQTPSGDIHGTLLLPDVAGKVPLVIIVAGSGATDRDGNSPQMSCNAYRMLADSLASHGIASLRYDKRGIRASVRTPEKELRFGDYINDLCGWVDMYAADDRFSCVIVAGHSEGSQIGIAAAAHCPGIAGVISIAGPGRPLDEVIREQLARQSVPQELRAEADSVMERLKKGEEVPEVTPILAGLFRPSVQPYMISWLKYDPAAEIAKIDAPVLILQGTTDIQVGVNDAEQLAKANSKAMIVLIEGMNHVMKYVGTTDMPSQMAAYANPEIPIDGRLVQACVEFVSGIAPAAK